MIETVCKQRAISGAVSEITYSEIMSFRDKNTMSRNRIFQYHCGILTTTGKPKTSLDVLHEKGIDDYLNIDGGKLYEPHGSVRQD